MKTIKSRYEHYDNIHNFSAAEEMVPYIVNLLQPNSVVDVGCGTGTWLKVFENAGISDFLGIDGNYVDRKKLKISNSNFTEYDLEKKYNSPRKYDIAISLEVAEHLKQESADLFITTLANLSDTLIFSAAIPNQGGQNHLNEQPPMYWIAKLEQKGYKCFDVLRPIFWENKNVDCWYKQNIFLLTKDEVVTNKVKNLPSFLNHYLVHPELLEIKEKMVQSKQKNFEIIRDGKKGIRFYLQVLFKAIKCRF